MFPAGSSDSRTFRSKAGHSNLRSVNPSLSFRRWANKSIDALHASPKASQDRRGLRSRVPVDQRALKKATFQWIKGEVLGEGTYARVYLALNATTGELMAVKQVELPQTASDKMNSRHREIIEALDFERKTLMDLDHVNIVQYLGYEESLNFLSIFLEYVPGGTISSCLQNRGERFTEEVTKSFASQILEGLAYLHSKGILHRDLKSDNILIEATGVCKITDFGISKRAEDIDPRSKAYTAMKGTIYWMAPEVLGPDKDEGYDVKADIWSFGCIVQEMWTGSRPWHGEDLFPVMMKLLDLKLPPPLPSDLSVSESASDFRCQCFRPDPNDRPPAKELKKHPYLLLPLGWRFELSQIQGRRRSLSPDSSKSRRAMSPVESGIVHCTSSDVSETDDGPPLVYITPPSSPSYNLSRMANERSVISRATPQSPATPVPTTKKGFRIVNPDPDPDLEPVTFIYAPPPLPGLTTAPYSSRLAPPSLFGVINDAYPESSSHTIFQSPVTSRSVSRSLKSETGLSSMSGWSGSDDTYGWWQKPPSDLTTIAPVAHSRYRINRRSGAGDDRPFDRPHPTEVYDNLENFFPDFDFDKSVMTVSPAGSSNTDVRERQVKKSIRMVVEEQSNRAPSSRRTTKLWDSKVEQLG